MYHIRYVEYVKSFLKIEYEFGCCEPVTQMFADRHTFPLTAEQARNRHGTLSHSVAKSAKRNAVEQRSRAHKEKGLVTDAKPS